jgi:hypothetical protein
MRRCCNRADGYFGSSCFTRSRLSGTERPRLLVPRSHRSSSSTTSSSHSLRPLTRATRTTVVHGTAAPVTRIASRRPLYSAVMRGRLEATAGRLLSEGELIPYGSSNRPRVPPSLGAPDEVGEDASEEYWVIRGMDVAEGTECVLVIAGERFDVVVVNGTLRRR